MSRVELDEAAEALDEVARFLVRQTSVLREVSFSASTTLTTLALCGPHRITELAARERVSQPSMTTMVTRLERQGMVQRSTDPSDGRIVQVAITEAGRDMVRRRHVARVAFLADLIDGLSPEEQQSLARIAPVMHKLTDPASVPAALDAAKRAVQDGSAEHDETLKDTEVQHS